nr:retrotransposon Gag domain, retroviral aspartyl protease [Tanacetum cinerariifolium]
MVQTHNSENNNPPDPIATQLAVIAAKLEAFEMMKEDIAALKEGERSRSNGNGEEFQNPDEFLCSIKQTGSVHEYRQEFAKRSSQVNELKITQDFHPFSLGGADLVLVIPLPITKDWEIDLQPNSVITHRWVYEAGQPVLELLIAWCNRPVEEATWETYDLVVEQFPEFRLEDKAFYREGSNDKDQLKVEADMGKWEVIS